MENRKLRKEKAGIVVSNKRINSIVVEVERKVKQSEYGKFVKKVPVSWHTMKRTNVAKR